MQAAQLQYDQEQTNYAREAFIEEILQVLQRAHRAQGNEVALVSEQRQSLGLQWDSRGARDSDSGDLQDLSVRVINEIFRKKRREFGQKSAKHRDGEKGGN